MMKEGPLKQHVEENTDGVIKQKFITYRKKDGMLVKETSVRQFHGNGDYNDSYYHEPLAKISD